MKAVLQSDNTASPTKAQSQINLYDKNNLDRNTFQTKGFPCKILQGEEIVDASVQILLGFCDSGN